MAEIDAWLTEVRDAPDPDMQGDLITRILADASAVQAAAAMGAPARLRWRDWVAALGGWPAMGGLVAAGVAGLWIGVSPTGAMNDVIAQFLGETVSVGLVSDDGLLDWGIEG